MNFRHSRYSRQSKEIDLNITPLIDIVFLLLIFFMVSTNFNKFTQINLSLPKVSNEFSKTDTNTINLKITSEGNYYIDDMPVSHNDKRTLVSALRQHSKSFDDSTMNKVIFTISGDAKAPHQSIVQALDAASELGVSQIRIAAVRSH